MSEDQLWAVVGLMAVVAMVIAANWVARKTRPQSYQTRDTFEVDDGPAAAAERHMASRSVVDGVLVAQTMASGGPQGASGGDSN
jgi:FtsZ-interacting cell division protein ZipA